MSNEIVPEGTFAAKAVPTKLDDGSQLWFVIGKSAKKGTEQITVTVELTEGPATGAQLKWIGYVTPATVERTLESLRNFGFQGDDLAVDQPLMSPVMVVIEHETYEDKTRPKIKWVNQFGANSANVVKGTDRDLFAARLKGKMAAIPAISAPLPNGKPPAAKKGLGL